MAAQDFHGWTWPYRAWLLPLPQPQNGVEVVPLPWPEGSWVRYRATGQWGYVFRSECNKCYVTFPVDIAFVPEWIRIAAIRLDFYRATSSTDCLRH